jgi:hypothetical protein
MLPCTLTPDGAARKIRLLQATAARLWRERSSRLISAAGLAGLNR